MSAFSKLSWYANRLHAMGPAEMVHRVQEKMRKATEESAFAKFQPGELAPGALHPRLPAAEDVPEEVRAAILDDAAEILRGKFQVLHGQVLSVHTPPIWHRDYLAGTEAPTTARARKLNYREMPRGMDPRLVWELSRWTQLVRLAQAFYLTRDEHYRETIIGWLQDWQQKNPAGVGWNWTSPMEPGLRLINLCWLDALCGLPEELLAGLLPAHVWWVSRYRSFGSSANNHLLGELCGLICAVARWPQAEQWSQSLALLGAQMQQEILRQFGSDGGNLEEALHYHLFAWEMGWQAFRALEARGISIEPAARERLALAAAFFAEVVSPEEPWDFGDSDDAHITPIYGNEAHSLVEWRDWFAGESNAFTYWWGLAPESNVEPQHYVMFRQDDWTLRWDLSPLGFGSLAAHGHLDALHCSVWNDSLAVLIDPGTGSYFATPEERITLADRLSHNGPHLLDSSHYPQRRGPFLWAKPHPTPLRRGPTACLKLGSAKLQRTIQRLERGWRFEDECVEPFAVHWQLAPGWEVEPHDHLLILFREGHSLHLEIEGADLEITSRLCSPVYGKLCQSPAILCRASKGGRIITELTSHRLL